MTPVARFTAFQPASHSSLRAVLTCGDLLRLPYAGSSGSPRSPGKSRAARGAAWPCPASADSPTRVALPGPAPGWLPGLRGRSRPRGGLRLQGLLQWTEVTDGSPTAHTHLSSRPLRFISSHSHGAHSPSRRRAGSHLCTLAHAAGIPVS